MKKIMKKLTTKWRKLCLQLFSRSDKYENNSKLNDLPKEDMKEKQVFKQKESNIDPLLKLNDYLSQTYQFRYNLLTEEAEYCSHDERRENFNTITQRDLNSICLDARMQGINCWDRDVSRYIYSNKISVYHPFRHYLDNLPEWDGTERIKGLAGRVSANTLWIMGFHRWMLAMTAQWAGIASVHANSMAPLLISHEQGKCKSTFCKMLLPRQLQRYYTDSFDLSSLSQSERKLGIFGLINLDEFDKLPVGKMSLLKNLMQMADLNIRGAYKKNYQQLPRIASFIGTSNQKELLTDPTGSRRFLCVEVNSMIDCTDINHDQIYAQLKFELNRGDRYWFTGEEEAGIMQHNLSFYKQSPEEEVFYTCFRPAEEGEGCLQLPGAEIFKYLKKHNPAAMREASPVKFYKILTKTGITKVHTKQGNLYRVVKLVKAG